MAEQTTINYVSSSKLAYYDEKIKQYLESKDAAVKSELQGLITAEETRAKAAELTNAQAAQAAQTDVDNLEAYVGTFTASEGVDTIVKYIDVKTANIASDETVGAISDRVKAIEDDYLVEADKTELQGNIDAVSGVANAAVKQSDYDTKVAALEAEDARIAGLVATEKSRAEEAEAGLQTQIDTIMNNPDTEGVINSINEFTTYIDEHGEIAEGFRTDIDQNKADIAAHVATNHDFAGADATLKAELEGKINAKADNSALEEVSGKVTAIETSLGAEGETGKAIADLEASVATKASQEEVNTISGKVTTVEGKVSTLEGQMTTAEGKISTLEGEMDDVQAAVATKVEQEAYNTKITALEGEDTAIKGRLDSLEAASATHAAASDLTALATRVDAEEGKSTNFESRVAALEGVQHVEIENSFIDSLFAAE